MKKIILASYVLLSATALTAQTPPLIDSTDVQGLSDLGFQIAVQANGGNDLIKGVPNGIVNGVIGTIVGLIYAAIHRAVEKKRLRKKGLLK